MIIAVTGATGGLGAAIVRALIAHIHEPEVIGITRNPAKVQDPDIEYRQGDYTDKGSYLNALRDIDAVLLVSGMGDPKDRIPQHRNVIEAADENGVRKIVYTSILGSPDEAGFSPVVSSNRQTEEDVRNSGMQWVIGRNGIYIEPDIEYVENYRKAGKITNCAGEGKCAYTTRDELGYAYARMLLEEKHNGQTYNLLGPAITQAELARLFNSAFDLDLKWEPMTVEAYKAERVAELGEFLGSIIAGIYEGIQAGYSDAPSDYEKVSGRPHIGWTEYFRQQAAAYRV